MPDSAANYSFLIYMVVTLILMAGLLLAAWWLGARTTSRNKGIAYESGMLPVGSLNLPRTIPFYLVAIFFIVFDVESAFIFTWAAAWEQLGLPGLIHITFFIVALLLGLAWIWAKGGLEWGPSRRKHDADIQA